MLVFRLSGTAQHMSTSWKLNSWEKRKRQLLTKVKRNQKINQKSVWCVCADAADFEVFSIREFMNQ